jgi:hypothetical protein
MMQQDGTVGDAVGWAVYWAVDRAVGEAVYWAVCEVSGAIRWTDDGTAESDVAGAGRNDPDHPALQDFLLNIKESL